MIPIITHIVIPWYVTYVGHTELSGNYVRIPGKGTFEVENGLFL